MTIHQVISEFLLKNFNLLLLFYLDIETLVCRKSMNSIAGSYIHVHPFHDLAKLLTNPYVRKGQKLSLLMTWKSELG